MRNSLLGRHVSIPMAWPRYSTSPLGSGMYWARSHGLWLPATGFRGKVVIVELQRDTISSKDVSRLCRSPSKSGSPTACPLNIPDNPRQLEEKWIQPPWASTATQSLLMQRGGSRVRRTEPWNSITNLAVERRANFGWLKHLGTESSSGLKVRIAAELGEDEYPGFLVTRWVIIVHSLRSQESLSLFSGAFFILFLPLCTDYSTERQNLQCR
ncbi:hypothetical protein B0T24DRAFT_25865 [Lasiosphaeria ovina]|uniref:Uncharacterized protein n=1 Tax=Lasiosphaeria ovina TaxID=92902 RepID=A0AAE0TX71_9PEZI|nr:hypothetical protein B0T24DRAFT_25865 [Lasiosphaeria ovina]